MRRFILRFDLCTVFLVVCVSSVVLLLIITGGGVQDSQIFSGRVPHVSAPDVRQNLSLDTQHPRQRSEVHRLILDTARGLYHDYSNAFYNKIQSDVGQAREFLREQTPYMEPQPPFIQVKEESPEFYIQLSSLGISNHTILYRSTRYKDGGVTPIGDVTALPWGRMQIYPFHLHDKHLCGMYKLPPQVRHQKQICSDHTTLNMSVTPFTHQGEYVRHFQYYSRVGFYVMKHVMLSKNGFVWTRNIQVKPYMCWIHREPEQFVNKTSNIELHEEVFSLNQFWGDQYYHFNVEIIPRIVPHLHFLKQYQSVKIHVVSKKVCPYIELLGLNCSRLVWGAIKTKVLYLPQGGGCTLQGNPLLQQELSYIYLDHVAGRLKRPMKPALVLIQRTGTHSRGLNQHDEIAEYLREKALEHGLDFVIFADKRSMPTFEEQQEIFYRAVMVVGPHGAGFANLMWTRPPAVVIEILCKINYPWLVFPVLSQNLGHRHFTFQATSGCGGGMQINMTTLIDIVGFTMKNYVIH